MFTIKFVRQGSRDVTSLSAARYTVTKRDALTGVWIYPTLREESPVYLALGADEDQETYWEMFVENPAGKTVDRHRAITSP